MSQCPQLVVSAAVRAEDGQLVPISDTAHRPFGVLSIDPRPYGFRLWHQHLAALGDAQVTADETLARLNISAHASWALDHVDVTLYRAGTRVYLSEFFTPYANVWVHLTGYPTPEAAS